MSDLVGKSVGRYALREQLGEGGMATVYRAYDTRLEREVAIKFIRKDAFPPNQLEVTLKRFEREAKALARLSHTNIVKVHDYGEFEDTPYLVEEYLPGGTLKQRLGKPMPWQEAVQLLLPIARALEYAHRQGMVHRDVKPSNILITSEGTPMLTDFGIAKFLAGEETQNLTGTGVGIGTPEYMAPEQWTGSLGPGLDIYSLGVVFFELVTGRKPYTADTPAAILLKQVNDTLPSPNQFVPDLPEAVERFLLKALAKKPEDRYQNMGEVVRALDGLLVGQPLPTPPQEKTLFVQPGGGNAPSELEQTASAERSIGKTAVPIIPEVKGPALPRPSASNRRPWMIAGGIAVILLVVIAGVIGAIMALKKPAATIPLAAVPSATAMTETSLPTGTTLPLSTMLYPASIPTTVKPSFILQFKTSSYSASVTLDSSTEITQSMLTDVSGTPSLYQREGQTFNLNQDIKYVYEGNTVSSTYNVFLADLNPAASMVLTIESGWWGQSSVDILNAVVDPPVIVSHQVVLGPSKMTYSVPAQLLTTNSPNVISFNTTLAPQLPSSADTDQSKIADFCPNFQPSSAQFCIYKAHSWQSVATLPVGSYVNIGPSYWSADGQKIYFVAEPNKNGPYAYFVINADGSGGPKLVHTNTTSEISLSPDNQLIAFTDDCAVLRIMNTDGTDRHYLNTPGVRCIQYLRWSPDSNRLAIADQIYLNVPPSIWVINRDGTNLQRIFQFNSPIAQFFDMEWNPDGSLLGIWFATQQNGNESGYLLDPTGHANPQPADWATPFWWTPQFWPQWGINSSK